MTDIVKGKRVYCSLYGGRCGTIYAVNGEPGSGESRNMAGGAVVLVSREGCHVDVVFDDGSMARSLPESILTGVQWDFLDEPLQTDEQIQVALDHAQAVREKAEAEREAARKAFAQHVEELKSAPRYAHLPKAEDVRRKDPRCDGAKLAAKNIRRQLKKYRPDVKFSVRKDGHNCVWVTWPAESDSEDVNQKAIRDLLEDFKTGYYDPHEDYHYSRDSAFNVVYGGVDYLTCQKQF